jgi:hypothetical protein
LRIERCLLRWRRFSSPIPIRSHNAMSGFIAMLVLTVILWLLFAAAARAMFGD